MVYNNNYDQTYGKVKKFRWFIHLMIFASVQFYFFMFDDYSGWHILNLNPMGEWTVDNLSPLVEWFQLYENDHFNLVTLGWGVILIIDGLVSISVYFK